MITPLHSCGSLACNLSWLLQAVVVLPFVAGLAFLFLPKSSGRLANAVGMGVSIFVLVSTLVLWKLFTSGISGYAYLSSVDLGLGGLGAHFQLGLNGLSLPLFILTAIVGLAAGAYIYAQKYNRVGLIWSMVLLILSGTLGAFASVDLFYAFFLHELALLPILLSLMIFGGSQRRQTALEVAFFLLMGSLIFLAGLLSFYFSAGLHSFCLLDLRHGLSLMPMEDRLWSWGLLLLGTLILSGVWPFYSWVPKLLEQAPTPVSMIVGGALKFFGLYILLQGFLPTLHPGILQTRTLLSILCVTNIIFIGIAALTQTDLRKLIAYSAVMHMGTLFLALNAATSEAYGGLVLLIVGSGLATVLLFMLSGIIRRRAGSAQMIHLGGLRQSAPRISAFLMIGFMAIAALPCFISFYGEFAVVLGVFRTLGIVGWAILAGLAITAGYCLRALSQMLMGGPKPAMFQDLSTLETATVWLLAVPVVALVFFPSSITNSLNLLLPMLTSNL